MKRLSLIDVVLLMLAGLAVTFAGLSYIGGALPPSDSTGGTRAEALARTLLGARLAPTAPPWEPINVVLAVQTTCPACERNAANWTRLARELPSQVSLRAVGYQSEAETQAWMERHGLPGRTIVRPIPVEWGVAVVPTTLVLSQTGQVVAAEVGVLGVQSMERVHMAVDSLAASLSPTRR